MRINPDIESVIHPPERPSEFFNSIPYVAVKLNQCPYCPKMVYLDEQTVRITEDEPEGVSHYAHLTCFTGRWYGPLSEEDDEEENGGC